VSERLANNNNEQQLASETIDNKQQVSDKDQQNQPESNTIDNVHEPISKSSDPGRQGSGAPLPQTNKTQDKRLAALKKPRRDSGIYPPSWKALLSDTQTSSAPTGIPEVSFMYL